VKSLIHEIENPHNEATTEDLQLLLTRNVFVGIVNSSFYLIQYETKLFLVDYSYLLLHLFYQLTLFQFQTFSILSLENNPIPIAEYILHALEHPPPHGDGHGGNEDEVIWSPEDGPKDELANAMTTLLISKQELLLNYFSITITSDGFLTTLPQLLEDYHPIPEGLPYFLLRLASEPDWENEKECFDQICKEIALFYSALQPPQKHQEQEGLGITLAASLDSDAPALPAAPSSRTSASQRFYLSKEAESKLVNHLLPAIKYYLVPLNEFRENGTFVQIADLKNLYKIFERC
jgi:DNA mismatch repair protein MLH1